MADLMKSVKTTFVSPKKGETLEGTITKLTSLEILVDIGAKTESVVLEKDKRILRNLLSALKVGDKVTVSVLNPESDLGNSVVSLRRFIGDRVWKKLEEIQNKKELVEVMVKEITKGGFIIAMQDETSGFLPNSQSQFLETGQNPIGKTLKVSVLELNRAMHKIIFSQKKSVTKEDFAKVIAHLKPEQKIDSIVNNITPFGIFTTIQDEENSVEGFIHLSEISWDKLSEVPQAYKAGEKIQTAVIGIDKKSQRVNLSIKRLTADPFQKELEKFVVDKKVTAKISKILTSGVLLDLGEGLEGMIKKEKIPPTVTYKEGMEITATVSSVDKERHRIILVPVLKEKPIGYR